MNRWFVKILNETNIPYIGGGHGPRIQDLRFTFCCHSLKQLIEKGIDTYVFLPTLSQYMGHSSIQSTEYYLMLTKEIYPVLVKNRSKLDSKVFPEVKKMKKTDFAYYVGRYLNLYIPTQRAYSDRTCEEYGRVFSLLLKFLNEKENKDHEIRIERFQ